MSAKFQKVGRPRITVLEMFLFVACLFIAPRLGGALILLILILLYIFFPLYQSRRVLIIACIMFFVSVLLPIDIDVDHFHGPIYGSHHSGVRFVRMVKGKPKMNRCLAKYGEFIAGGCVVQGYEPIWLLIWD